MSQIPSHIQPYAALLIYSDINFVAFFIVKLIPLSCRKYTAMMIGASSSVFGTMRLNI